MATRRSVIMGFGGLLATAGLITTTGAFSTVSAERSVSVETAGDAKALLGLAPVDRGDGFNPPGEGDGPDGGPPGNPNPGGNPPPFQDGNPYVSITDGTIEITLTPSTGLPQNSVTTFRNLVQITNQGVAEINEITLAFVTSGMNANETFRFPIGQVNGSGQDEVGNGENILTGVNGIPNDLAPGNAVNFGITVDLVNGGSNGSLPPTSEYTLKITANS